MHPVRYTQKRYHAKPMSQPGPHVSRTRAGRPLTGRELTAGELSSGKAGTAALLTTPRTQ